ncbi:MAG: class I lanthipeptide [Thermoanaerobaculia bacterium]
MKKRIQRLYLSKETLRNLQASNLAGIAGGTAQTSMECLQATGCECYTQDPGCTLPQTACFGTCSC